MIVYLTSIEKKVSDTLAGGGGRGRVRRSASQAR